MTRLFIGSALLSAAGAVTAIVAAVQDNYAVCSVALFAVASGGIGAYVVSRYRMPRTTAPSSTDYERLPTSPSTFSRANWGFALLQFGSASTA